MTDNAKKLLEILSEDKALAENFSAMSKDELFVAAKALGIPLTENDLAKPGSELSENELSTISGGQDHEPHDGKIGCFCTLVGGGGGKDEGETFGCACVGYGQGGHGQIDSFVCACLGGGIGDRD